MTPTTKELRYLLGQYNLPTDCDCDNEDCVKCAHYPTFKEAAAKQIRALAPDLLDEVIRLRAENAEMIWQPIETAPKDGSAIILTEADRMEGSTRLVGCGRWQKYAGFWHGVSGHGAWIRNPTHWMPLPDDVAGLVDRIRKVDQIARDIHEVGPELPSIGLDVIAVIEAQAARIASLEARIAAADRLADAVVRLNNACDAMWNDHERLEKNPCRFGQKWQLKELHMKAISEAQQALPEIIAATKGEPK